MKNYDKGDYEQFFTLWNKYVPFNVRNKDETAKKLEFYVQIHFLIYNINPKSGRVSSQIPKQNVQFFKTYLDTKGQE